MNKLQIILVVVLMHFAFGTAVCFPGNPVLRAGISKVDITPGESLYMGGYDESCRDKPSDGISGKIYARALVFDDNVKKIAFIEVDVVSLPRNAYYPVRKLVSQATGIPIENIMLGCVHNHAAPLYDEINSKSEWYKNFSGYIVKSVKEAVSDLEPVKIGGGIGRSNIAMNRRKKMEDTLSVLTFDENNSSQSYGKYKTDNPLKIREMEGVYRLGANPEGPIDDQVGIMRIDKLSGQPKAVFVNYACHGTTLGARNNKICPEWNGYMLEYIEKNIPGVTGIFAQGAAGDINPRFVGGLDDYTDNIQKTTELGNEIGMEVVKVTNRIVTVSPANPEIKLLTGDIVCPLKYDEVVKNFKNTTISIPTTVIKIDKFSWVTFPGEMFHEIGMKIKSDSHSSYPFLVGYCNGSFGYLPTQQAYGEGGYEPWSSRFDPATEKILVKGVDKMIVKLP